MDLDFDASLDADDEVELGDESDEVKVGAGDGGHYEFDAYKAVDEHGDLSETWPIDCNPLDHPANQDTSCNKNKQGEEKKEEEYKPEGWYSATEKYSPVIVPYETAAFKAKHIHTICNMMAVEGKSDAGSIRLIQFNGYPVKVKTELENMDADTEYKLRINLYGAMGDRCENVGPEFNPLREINGYGE